MNVSHVQALISCILFLLKKYFLTFKILFLYVYKLNPVIH